jgi:hypothetical protein
MHQWSIHESATASRPRRQRRPLVSAVLCLCVSVGDAKGQVAPSAPFKHALLQMHLDQRLRVKTAGYTRESRFVGASADSLLVRDAGQRRQISLAAIEGLWIRERATGAGAKRGAVAGAIAVAAFGSFFVWGLGDSCSTCGNEYPRVIVVGGAIGAAGGALLGAGIGSLLDRWRAVLP